MDNRINYHYGTTFCRWCKKSFEKMGMNHIYCSEKCKYLGKKKRLNNKCKTCGVLISPRRTYCKKHRDMSVFKEYVKNKDKFRDKNPHWKGGVSVEYAKSLLKHINVCQKCKKRVEGYKRHIHHKNRNKKDNGLENLIVLCAKCHVNEHHGVKK